MTLPSLDLSIKTRIILTSPSGETREIDTLSMQPCLAGEDSIRERTSSLSAAIISSGTASTGTIQQDLETRRCQEGISTPRDVRSPLPGVSDVSSSSPTPGFISQVFSAALRNPAAVVTGAVSTVIGFGMLPVLSGAVVGGLGLVQLCSALEKPDAAVQLCRELNSQAKDMKALQSKQQSIFEKIHKEEEAIETQLREALQRLVRLQETLDPTADGTHVEKIATLTGEIDRLLVATEDGLRKARDSFQKTVSLTPDLETLNHLLQISQTSTPAKPLTISAETLSRLQTLTPRLLAAIETLQVLDSIFRELEELKQQLRDKFIEIITVMSIVHEEKNRMFRDEIASQKITLEASQAQIIQLRSCVTEGERTNQQAQDLREQQERVIDRLQNCISNANLYTSLMGAFSILTIVALIRSRSLLTCLLALVAISLNALMVQNRLKAFKESGLFPSIQFLSTAWRVTSSIPRFLF